MAQPVLEQARCFTREELASAEPNLGNQGGAGGNGGDAGVAGQAGESAGQGGAGEAAGGQSVGGQGGAGQASAGEGGSGGAPDNACPMIDWRTHPGIDTPWSPWRANDAPTQQGDQCCYVLRPSCG